MFKPKRPVMLLLAALLLAFAASCGSANAPSASPSAKPAESASPSTTDADPSPSPSAAPKEIVTIKFSEVIRSIFYAPYYAAISQGYFEDEGLKLDMNTAQGSDKGAAALIAGTADISLVGPETAIYIYNQQGDKKLKIFHQLTMKDGSFLLSRDKTDAFDWHALAGKKIIGWRPGSAPQMVMASALKAQGAEGANVVTNIAAPAMAGAFASGQGDYIQLFEPVASTLIAEGKAYYVASLGETFGDFPETSFVATSDYIEKNPQVIQGFVNAVAKATAWLASASDDEIAAALSPYFEGTPKERIVESVRRYQKQDTWPATPVLTPEAFDKLQSVLIDNGVLKAEDKIADMNAIVDMSFVQRIGKAE
ncbi:ABC transporter substrate-binding protein [Cohnella sp. GCM10020058]|uniref:ABC transporter substrate-binding protein n=1 Tax=Cohnella sp. GCM10020058 TaxID=3317330 RepID=UPI00362EE487